jgi:protein-tyrosine phosphatase
MNTPQGVPVSPPQFIMSVTPERVVRLQGASNFRDLGGYAGHGGRSVRWRQLFRAEHLAGLTADDHAALRQLGVSRAFDFRGQAESAHMAYEIPGVLRHSLAIEPTVVQSMQAVLDAGEALRGERVGRLMEDLYRSLVNDRSHRFAELFEQVLDTDAPVVFHCTAGKDRTGWAAALLLLALGVSMPDVEHDYLLTNQLLPLPSAPPPGMPEDAWAVLWRVQPSYLQAALQVVDQRHGGMQAYLADRMKLSNAALQTLRDRYLSAE